jgi:hypothetical protein
MQLFLFMNREKLRKGGAKRRRIRQGNTVSSASRPASSSAEVNLGTRTVMEYLLSPVQKVTPEAGRAMQGLIAGSQIEKKLVMHAAGRTRFPP